MVFDVNDRWSATFSPAKLGRHQFEVTAWSDHPETWRHGTARKVEADLDVRVELLSGEAIVGDLVVRARATSPPVPADIEALDAFLSELSDGDAASLDDPRWAELSWRYADRDPVASSGPYFIDVDPERGTVQRVVRVLPALDACCPATGHRTLRDAIDRLDHVAAMGFDVVYLPPIHPIGQTNRKGRNNTHRRPRPTTSAARGRIGAPRAATPPSHPELGTVDDVDVLAGGVPRARHRAGARHRLPVLARPPVGHRASRVVRATAPTARSSTPRTRRRSTRTSTRSTSSRADWAGAVGRARRRRSGSGSSTGVTVFRVDNPHTKPFAVLGVGDLRRSARRAPRDDLPRRGVHPAAGHGAARQGRLQPVVHVLHLAPVGVGAARVLHRSVHPHRRLLPAQRLAEHARHPHRAAAARRPGRRSSPGPSSPRRCRRAGASTARRSSCSSTVPVPPRAPRSTSTPRSTSCASGTSTDADSRRRRCSRGSTRSAAQQPALQHLRTLRFHDTDNRALLCYTKTDPAGAGDPIAGRRQPRRRQPPGRRSSTSTSAPLGLPYDSEYEVVDLLGGGTLPLARQPQLRRPRRRGRRPPTSSRVRRDRRAAAAATHRSRRTR